MNLLLRAVRNLQKKLGIRKVAKAQKLSLTMQFIFKGILPALIAIIIVQISL
jgi:hypothetical protein